MPYFARAAVVSITTDLTEITVIRADTGLFFRGDDSCSCAGSAIENKDQTVRDGAFRKVLFTDASGLVCTVEKLCTDLRDPDIDAQVRFPVDRDTRQSVGRHTGVEPSPGQCNSRV